MSRDALHASFYRRLAEFCSLETLLQSMSEDWLEHLALNSVKLTLAQLVIEVGRPAGQKHLSPLPAGGSLEVTGESAEEALEVMLAQLGAARALTRSQPLESLFESLQELDQKAALERFHQAMLGHLGEHDGVVYEGGQECCRWGQPPAHQEVLQVLGESQRVEGCLAQPLPDGGAVILWPRNGASSGAFELAAKALGFVLKNCRLYREVLGAKRTLEESQAQIVHSSKMAAVGQLAAGVAHELNSPLGAVMLQLDAAVRNLERQRYEKVADKLESAEKAAATAKEIISKLLFYSRDATKGLRQVNLNDVVHDTLALLGKQLSYDDLKIELDLQKIPRVQANQNELQQVVTNLLLNARDAVLEPGAESKTVEVSTSCGNGEVRLEVSDHGSGIPDEILAKIFDPFFTTKPVGRGTGLGLSVSHKIVEQHGGRLAAENLDRGGARFTMVLAEG